MRYIVILVCFAALSGCSFHQQQNDLADNQFFIKEKHADATATYVGAWAVDLYKWRKVLSIDATGRVKIVLAPEYGAIEGKVYMENSEPFIILKDGTKAGIVNSGEKYLLIQAYGKQEEFTLM